MIPDSRYLLLGLPDLNNDRRVTVTQHHPTTCPSIKQKRKRIMAQFDQLYVFENEEIIARVKKFLKDGSGCSYGRKRKSMLPPVF